MALIVVGGSTRNIGKTSVVAGLIKAMVDRRWTAIKITQYGHGVCSADGQACDCATADHNVAFTEERNPEGKSDTARYLKAGAQRSLWVRTQQGALFEAIPRLRREIAEGGNVIVESNSIIQFVQPDLYISVLDPGVEDLKSSARRFLDRAGLILLPEESPRIAAWHRQLQAVLRRSAVRYFRAGEYMTEEIVDFVAARIAEESQHVAALSGASR